MSVVAVAASPSGDLLASADLSGHIHIYSSPDLRNRFTVNLRTEVRALSFSASGRFLVGSTAEGFIAAINTRTGASMDTSPTERAPSICAQDWHSRKTVAS